MTAAAAARFVQITSSFSLGYLARSVADHTDVRVESLEAWRDEFGVFAVRASLANGQTYDCLVHQPCTADCIEEAQFDEWPPFTGGTY